MSVSAVQIANMALSNVGARSSIESFTEDSVEANLVSLWYDNSRKQTLEAINWTFARKRLALALHAEAADEIEWFFRYQYPSDALKIRKLVNPLGPKANAVPFRLEQSADGTQKTILTNLEEAVSEYTFNQTLIASFSLMFVETLAYCLAHHIAYPLSGKLDLTDKMLGKYMAMLRIAAASDGNEHVDDTPREAEWISGR